jgi:DNA-binding NarL/FixJ family response regulator
MKKIRILLADDQVLVRAGIRALLERRPEFEIVAECDDGRATLAAIQSLRPDVALLDIAMPGISGIAVAQAVRAFDAQVRLLVLSGIERQTVVDEALAAGVNGYLLKDFVLAELDLALDVVLAGGRFLSPRLQAQLIERVLAPDGGVRRDEIPGSLTPRQTEVLRRVAAGRSTKEIARELGISPKTVEFHRAQLMARLDVHDIAGLTRYALQHGLIA